MDITAHLEKPLRVKSHDESNSHQLDLEIVTSAGPVELTLYNLDPDTFVSLRDLLSDKDTIDYGAPKHCYDTGTIV